MPELGLAVQDPPEVEAIIVEQKLVAASKNVGYMSAVMDMAGCFKKARQNVLALGELVDEVQQANTTNADENARWEIFCTEILERCHHVCCCACPCLLLCLSVPFQLICVRQV